MTSSILITGANGYLGQETLKILCQDRDKYKNIVGVDIREAGSDIKDLPITYDVCNILDKEKLDSLIKENHIDVVVHLASIVTPGKKSNRELEYQVDVVGTRNVLESCVKNGCKKIIVTSSGAAYGYYADHPEWLVESDPIRGNKEFAYSYHKRLVEEMMAEYRQKHPELAQIIFRPGTILGENTSNQITNLFKKKMVMGIRGSDSPFIFIWDRDVVDCMIEGINTDKTGIFNLAGDGKLSMRELAGILGKPYLNMPPSVLKGALFLLKKLGLTQYGPEQLNFLRYRPVLLNKSLKEQFKYIPKKTSKETFLFYLDHQK